MMEFLHPANAEEVANIAQETGAEVLRGPLRYPRGALKRPADTAKPVKPG